MKTEGISERNTLKVSLKLVKNVHPVKIIFDYNRSFLIPENDSRYLLYKYLGPTKKL